MGVILRRMSTAVGALTQGIARVLRGELAKAQQNTTWFGGIIGVSQSQASKILRGIKPITLDQLQLASEAFGLRMSQVISMAEPGSPDPGNEQQADRRVK